MDARHDDRISPILESAMKLLTDNALRISKAKNKFANHTRRFTQVIFVTFVHVHSVDFLVFTNDWVRKIYFLSLISS